MREWYCSHSPITSIYKQCLLGPPWTPDFGVVGTENTGRYGRSWPCRRSDSLEGGGENDPELCIPCHGYPEPQGGATAGGGHQRKPEEAMLKLSLK